MFKNVNTNKIQKLLPWLVYVIGLAISAHYAITTNFTTVSDTFNEYSIYQWYINNGFSATWYHFMHIGYTLQLHCLTSTLVPALIHVYLPVNPLVLFKVYIVVLSPLLPLSVFILSRRFVPTGLSLAVALLVMSQTSYIQSPSNFRTIISIAMFAVLLYVIITEQRKRKYVYIALLCIAIALTHYGTAIISGAVLVVAGLHALVRKHKAVAYIVSAVLLILISYLWNPLPFTMAGSTAATTMQQDAQGNPVKPQIVDPGAKSPYDKIIQAAMGVHNPDGDTKFKFSWPLFILSWMMILLTGYGLLRYIKTHAVPAEYPVMGIVFAVLAVLMFAVPYFSRIYGIERLWVHSLIVLAPAFVLGIGDVLKRVKLSPMLMYLFIGLYFWFNYHYGLIYSIMG